jgi:major membrane immunogen (membrane-anchored lipoprotein)
MNKIKFIPFLCFIMLLSTVQCVKKQKNTVGDGVFVGKSHAVYDNEPFVGVTKITVKNDSIQNVEFQLVDTSKNEVFDQNYDSHFWNNPEYQEQCHKDWYGVLYYPKQLIKKQKLSDVDAVSGATWSYNLFQASANQALRRSGLKR